MVSIIIPCYNQEKYIEDCLLSVENQTYKDIEVIVVDDCSKDKSIKILSKYFGKHTILFNPENKGVSATRNAGILYSSGEYIVCLDGDDMLLPDSIKARAECFEKHPDVDVVWANAYKINDARGNSSWTYGQCIAAYGGLEVYSRRINAQTIMWKRKVFEKYGLYYEGLKSKEDKELLFRLGLHPDSPMPAAVKAKKIDDFVAIYRRHPNAKHKRRCEDKKWFEETEKIFNKRIKDLKSHGITKENTRLING